MKECIEDIESGIAWLEKQDAKILNNKQEVKIDTVEKAKSTQA